MKRFLRPLLSGLGPLVLAAGLLAPDAAQASTPVLVAGFQAADNTSAGLAAMLSVVLESYMSDQHDLDVVLLDEVPPLHGTSIRTYLESCPHGDQVGCAFVVGQHAEVEYAITGRLRTGDAYLTVALSLVDVGESREAVGLELIIPHGQDHLLMEQVATLLGRLVRGEIGQLEDIREPQLDEEDTRVLVEEELEALVAESGGEVQLGGLATGMELTLPSFTPEDVERMKQEEEGLTEWERLGMTEGAYLAYRNSGLDLQSWRALARGRQLQVLVRPRAGLVIGPVHGHYHARFIMDDVSDSGLSVVETYAYQAVSSGVGGGYGLDLAFGLTPSVEIEAGVGRVHGRYTWLVQQEVVDEYTHPSREHEQSNASLMVTAGLRLVPFPARDLRPLLGASFLYWRGQPVTSQVDLSSLDVELPTWAAPTLMGVRGVVGGELRLGEYVDLVAQLPLAIVVGTAHKVHDEHYGALQDKQEPPTFVPFASGIELGVQVRFFGADPSRRGPRQGQVEDEEELDLLD